MKSNVTRHVAGILLACMIVLVGCSSESQGIGQVQPQEEPKSPVYSQISQTQALTIMEYDKSCVVVDVRRQDEYDAGHIPGAILIPNEEIGSERPEELPDLKQTILVYCRSGRRSKEAAQKLADMGYENVYEFGGIIDWTGEVTTDDTTSETE